MAGKDWYQGRFYNTVSLKKRKNKKMVNQNGDEKINF